MLVDTLLKYYGHNPAYYQSSLDKQIEVVNDVLNTTYPILTVLLTLIPWIFYFLQKNKYQKTQKHFLWTIVKFSISGLLFGLFLPTLVIWITGALAVRAIYGG